MSSVGCTGHRSVLSLCSCHLHSEKPYCQLSLTLILSLQSIVDGHDLSEKYVYQRSFSLLGKNEEVLNANSVCHRQFGEIFTNQE